MQASSVFLLPTRIDTGPNSVERGARARLWPVCYDNSGPGEYVRRFQFGSLAPDLDLPTLTSTLRTAIEMRPWAGAQLREELGARTREAFSPENIWAKLVELYAEIVADSIISAVIPKARRARFLRRAARRRRSCASSK